MENDLVCATTNADAESSDNELSNLLGYLVIKLMEKDKYLIVKNDKTYKLELNCKLDISDNKLKKVIVKNVKFREK